MSGIPSLVVVANKLKWKVPLCLIWGPGPASSTKADSLDYARGGLGYSQIGHVRDVAKKRGRVEEGKPSAVTDGQPASLVGFPRTPNKVGRGEAGGRAVCVA